MKSPSNPSLPPGMDMDAWRELAQEDQRAWLQWAMDVRKCLEQPEFRRFIIRVIDDPDFCGAHRSVFDKDPLAMAYKAGLQAAGQQIRDQLQHIAPNLWRKALNEEQKARDIVDTPSEDVSQ